MLNLYKTGRPLYKTETTPLSSTSTGLMDRGLSIYLQTLSVSLSKPLNRSQVFFPWDCSIFSLSRSSQSQYSTKTSLIQPLILDPLPRSFFAPSSHCHLWPKNGGQWPPLKPPPPKSKQWHHHPVCRKNKPPCFTYSSSDENTTPLCRSAPVSKLLALFTRPTSHLGSHACVTRAASLGYLGGFSMGKCRSAKMDADWRKKMAKNHLRRQRVTHTRHRSMRCWWGFR